MSSENIYDTNDMLDEWKNNPHTVAMLDLFVAGREQALNEAMFVVGDTNHQTLCLMKARIYDEIISSIKEGGFYA